MRDTAPRAILPGENTIDKRDTVRAQYGNRQSVGDEREDRAMSGTSGSYGTLYGCHWERHPYGITVFGSDSSGVFRMIRFAGNGSDRVTVRGSVLAFRRLIGVTR